MGGETRSANANLISNKPMKIQEFLKQLDDAPETIMLDDALNTIDALYEFTPVAFSNGSMRNQAGEAVRSCRIYAFSRLYNLTEQQTLLCFGEHYREVLADPGGTSHMTIRTFMKLGRAGVDFESFPLKARPVRAMQADQTAIESTKRDSR